MKDLTETPNQSQAAGHDILSIRQRLPHRYPFLMVDRIEDVGPGYALGLKNITANEPCFQGHFPDFPVMPGVLITEACLQTAAFMGPTPGDAGSEAPDPATTRFFCVGFDMKFTGLVSPGDQMRMEIRLVRRMAGMTRVKARVTTANGVVASGDLSLALQSVPSPQPAKE